MVLQKNNKTNVQSVKRKKINKGAPIPLFYHQVVTVIPEKHLPTGNSVYSKNEYIFSNICHLRITNCTNFDFLNTKTHFWHFWNQRCSLCIYSLNSYRVIKCQSLSMDLLFAMLFNRKIKIYIGTLKSLSFGTSIQHSSTFRKYREVTLHPKRVVCARSLAVKTLKEF